MYQPGDDLRYIDWRMYGRSDRYYIKQFEEETNLRAYLLLDVSASMAWTSAEGRCRRSCGTRSSSPPASRCCWSGRATPWDCSRSTRHALARRAARRPPALARAAAHAGAARGGGRTDPGTALRDLAGRLRRRGLVMLISDLLVDPEATRLALRFLRHRGHEVLVFHLLDPGERELPGVGDARFVDPETDEELPVSAADVRREYREAVERARRSGAPSWRRRASTTSSIGTDEPMAHALRAYLHKRERLG
jgi:uncharacterized protein (DUF58 family)